LAIYLFQKYEKPNYILYAFGERVRANYLALMIELYLKFCIGRYGFHLREIRIGF